MAQICTKSFVGWGFAPDPKPQTPLGELIAPPGPLADLGGGIPGEGEREAREREGRGRWDCDPSTRDGKGGEGNGGKDGSGRVWKGKGGEGRGGEREEISIHGLKLVAPPMESTVSIYKIIHI